MWNFNNDEMPDRRRRMMPPINGATPPIMAPQDVRHEGAPMPPPLAPSGPAPTGQTPPIMAANNGQDKLTGMQKLSGVLGAAGSLLDNGNEEYLEPMPMQQPQGQMFQQAPPLWGQQAPMDNMYQRRRRMY